MTTDRTQGAHPTDLELAAWADEPETRAADIEAHVEGCISCRGRIAELAVTRAALALDPPMPSEAAFVEQRERIFAAIGAPPRAKGGRVVRRIAWLAPLAAAAAIAAIVLVSRTDGPRAPGTADAGPETTPAVAATTLPVVADAREAAEDAASEAFDEDALDAALAAAEPLAPPISIERAAMIESRFAELPEEEQDAVLLELASVDFDF